MLSDRCRILGGQGPSASGHLHRAWIGHINRTLICLHPATQYKIKPKTGSCKMSKWWESGTGGKYGPGCQLIRNWFEFDGARYTCLCFGPESI